MLDVMKQVLIAGMRPIRTNAGVQSRIEYLNGYITTAPGVHSECHLIRLVEITLRKAREILQKRCKTEDANESVLVKRSIMTKEEIGYLCMSWTLA